MPYDAEGRLTAGDERTWLDLRAGQRVKITAGHNIKGAGQPAYEHITTGEGRVLGRDDGHASFTLDIQGARMRLGLQSVVLTTL